MLGLGEVDVCAQNIRQYGLPDLTDGTAAAEDGLIHGDAARLHAVAQGVGYALQDSQAHVLAGGGHGQANERAAGVHIVVGATLTREVGEEVHACLAVFRLGGVAVVGIQNITDPPLVAGGGGEDTAHEVEPAVGMAEVVEGGTARGIELVAGQEDGAAGAEGNAAIAVAKGIGAHGRAGVVPCARAESQVY